MNNAILAYFQFPFCVRIPIAAYAAGLLHATNAHTLGDGTWMPHEVDRNATVINVIHRKYDGPPTKPIPYASGHIKCTLLLKPSAIKQIYSKRLIQ